MRAQRTKKSKTGTAILEPAMDSYGDQSTEQWEVARLEPHPRQAELVGEYTVQEIQELADDIEGNGLKHPIEVLPDGHIVAGHRRKAALERLGRTTIPVIVRHDLAAQGEAAVEMYLIRDNLTRMHYHPLKIARLYLRMKELDAGRSMNNSAEAGDLRDQLAKQFKKSGRTLDRYAAVLRTPRVIQEAVERDELPMSTAEAIARLSDDVQGEIVQAIAEGTPPKEAAARHLNSRPASQPAVGDRIAALARTLERTEAKLRGEIDEIESGDPDMAEHVSVFTAIRDSLNELIERIGEVGSGSCRRARGGGAV